jgi:carbon monoxide dehydrogenase subunit G
MARTTVSRTIRAPVARVFDTISDIGNFSKAVPDIVKVEFLTEQRSGPGTRFRETRRMGKREVSSELEVKDLVTNERVRMVSDQGGTVWDSVFKVTPAGDGATELTLVMDANAYKLAAKIFNPLIKGMIRKAIEKDLDAVKAYCEGGAS